MFSVSIGSKNSFKKIYHMIPKDLQKKESIVRIIFAYLEIGGKKLAEQSIEALKIAEELKISQNKHSQ